MKFLKMMTLTALLAFSPLMANNCCYDACSVPCCPPCWNGFYVGVSGGYAWSANNRATVSPRPDAATFRDLAPFRHSQRLNGGFGGGQIGYNAQWCKTIFGLEFDFSGSNISSRKRVSPIRTFVVEPPFTGSRLSLKEEVNWFGTLRGRLGYDFCSPFFVYVTGGLAFGKVKHHGLADFRPVGSVFYDARHHKTQVGWTVGAGVEYAFCDCWSLKAEYLYMDLGRRHFTANSAPFVSPFQVRYGFDTRLNLVRLGLNFRFK